METDERLLALETAIQLIEKHFGSVPTYLGQPPEVPPPPFQRSLIGTVTAADFWAAFRHAAYGRGIPTGEVLRNSWRTKLVLNTELTSTSSGRTDGLFLATSRLLGLEYRREFLNVDAILYRGTVSRRRVQAPLDVVVGIEHENDPHTSLSEMCKLRWTAFPLKVLITYPRGLHQQRVLLNDYSEILDGSDEEPERYLVIFGSGSRRWKAFLPTGPAKSFEEITE